MCEYCNKMFAGTCPVCGKWKTRDGGEGRW